MESSPKLFHLLCISLTLFSFLNSTYSIDDLYCNSHDKAILLQIKSHFKGVGLLSQWDPTQDCCTWWPFIGCTSEYDSNPGRVTAVTISGGSGLAGEIPAVIGELPFLEEIMFWDEPKLTGPIPQSISKLKKLQLLYLNSNRLTGNIPTFLGQLKSLREIDISDNHLSGSIPSSLSLLPVLSKLNVSRNSFTGSIPSMPKSLTSIDVSYNKLCGPIPTGLSKFGSASFHHNKCLCGPPLSPCK